MTDAELAVLKGESSWGPEKRDINKILWSLAREWLEVTHERWLKRKGGGISSVDTKKKRWRGTN